MTVNLLRSPVQTDAVLLSRNEQPSATNATVANQIRTPLSDQSRCRLSGAKQKFFVRRFQDRS